MQTNSAKPLPRSCDTFVVVPKNKQHPIIFGKNSDRPFDEAQHVVAYPAVESHPQGSQLKCTYISIPQASSTHAVILSKPCWMWGAEMASNDAGLVIGNEAVWTNEADDGPEALLGMDLVRLAAERCTTAVEAIKLIGELLETFGQGGGCEEGGSWSYHNSFLIADRNEAWVMETAGRWWVAESITSCGQGGGGDQEDEENFYFRNISNCLSIRTIEVDHSTNIRKYMHSTGLVDYAIQAGYWSKSNGQFDWALSFSSSRPPPRGQKTPGREAAGHQILLHKLNTINTDEIFTAEMMMEILRNQKSGICMCGGDFRSNGSQVSIIQRSSNNSRDVHYFTGTPDPSISCFKPLSFFKDNGLDKFGGGSGGYYNSEDDDVPLERVNEIAAALWDHGDRRNASKSAEVKLKELERIGLSKGVKVGGAKMYLEAAKKELEM